MATEMINGLPVDKLTYESIQTDLASYELLDQKMIMTSINAQIALRYVEQPEILPYIDAATHRLPDGAGIVKLSKLFGGSIKQRITGIDVMDVCLNYAHQHHKRIYLYGASQESVALAVANIKKAFPNIVIAGYLHGYTEEREAEIVNKINQVTPDFLFVALGFPRQEIFLSRNYQKINAKYFLDVGGTFDVISGKVKRAPAFYREHNLEWLYRSVKYKRFDRLAEIPLFVKRSVGYAIKQHFIQRKRAADQKEQPNLENKHKSN